MTAEFVRHHRHNGLLLNLLYMGTCVEINPSPVTTLQTMLECLLSNLLLCRKIDRLANGNLNMFQSSRAGWSEHIPMVSPEFSRFTLGQFSIKLFDFTKTEYCLWSWTHAIQLCRILPPKDHEKILQISENCAVDLKYFAFRTSSPPGNTELYVWTLIKETFTIHMLWYYTDNESYDLRLVNNTRSRVSIHPES